MKKYITLILLLIFAFNQVFAQVSFKASANKVVEMGENFRLSFAVNANGAGFKPPSINDFTVLAGPSTSTSSSFQYINGTTSQTLTVSYNYIIQATKTGKFTIDKAEITVDGNKYFTEPIVIEVIKGGTSNTNNNIEASTPSVSDENDDIFVRINLNKSTVYQGEQLIANIKVYDRMGLKSLTDYKFPSYTGFWTQDIESPGNISLQRENVNGKLYQTGLLKQTILFPQRSGNLIITPFELECIVQKKAGKRRNFFGDYVDTYVDINKKMKSSARSVKVLPLPENKPASFNGAVGENFSISAIVDRDNIKSNESITLKVKISGSGNIKLIDEITVNFPNTFEVFDPKINNNIENSLAGSKGSKTFEYLLIPREQGEYTIPQISFSYFDIISKSYKTLNTKELKINVEKGNLINTANNNLTVSKEDVQSIGTDIRHIELDDFDLKEINYNFFGSIEFYLFYIISILLFAISILILRRRLKFNSNIALQKNKYANKVSKKHLKTANSFLKLNDKEKFYNEVIKALWGYLSDKLNIPVSELSRDNVKETLIKYKVNEDVIFDFISVIDSCEFAKYSPASENNGLTEDYEKASKVINKMAQLI
ncbi:MAG: protein BatD [Bacteroidales bacterium]|nr:protein BatD [Bacteroidales bacterium]MBN2757475.1 protein BatD [Bacteroidales bacterium]